MIRCRSDLPIKQRMYSHIQDLHTAHKSDTQSMLSSLFTLASPFTAVTRLSVGFSLIVTRSWIVCVLCVYSLYHTTNVHFVVSITARVWLRQTQIDFTRVVKRMGQPPHTPCLFYPVLICYSPPFTAPLSPALPLLP